MSSPFDNLARTLATPMPRRQALRVVGTALAVAAFPALRAGPARGADGPCGTNGAVRCFVEIPFGTHEGGCYYPKLQKCCKGPNNDPVHPNQMSWVCPKDNSCGSAAGGFCPCPTKCKDGKCCPRSKGRCVNGTCCPAIRTTTRPLSNGKGVACCPAGTIAVPGEVGLCCPKGKPNCCRTFQSGDDDLAPLWRKGQLCVNGRMRKA